jgi:hypothetical protein
VYMCVCVKRVGIFALLASCRHFAAMLTEATLDRSITRYAFRDIREATTEEQIYQAATQHWLSH